MNLPMQNLDAYVFSKQPGYHEPTVRKELAKAVPLRTVVIYCYDPRACLGFRTPSEVFFEDCPPDDCI